MAFPMPEPGTEGDALTEDTAPNPYLTLAEKGAPAPDSSAAGGSRGAGIRLVPATSAQPDSDDDEPPTPTPPRPALKRVK
jgi:hypothetical protein